MAIEREDNIFGIAYQITIEEVRTKYPRIYSNFLRGFVNADGNETTRQAVEAALDERIFKLRRTGRLISEYRAKAEAKRVILASERTP